MKMCGITTYISVIVFKNFNIIRNKNMTLGEKITKL